MPRKKPAPKNKLLSMQEAKALVTQTMNDLLAGIAGWHRLARFGAYRCALAQEARRDQPVDPRTSFGCAAPVAQSGNQGHPATTASASTTGSANGSAWNTPGGHVAKLSTTQSRAMVEDPVT